MSILSQDFGPPFSPLYLHLALICRVCIIHAVLFLPFSIPLSANCERHLPMVPWGDDLKAANLQELCMSYLGLPQEGREYGADVKVGGVVQRAHVGPLAAEGQVGADGD